MSAEAAKRRHGPNPTIILAGLILLGFALRFWRLGNWGFDSDEVFMLRDSIDLQPTNPRPLMYILNHFLIRPWLPLDEFGLRLLPAVFGVLAIPAFYFLARRLVGTRAALFAAFLVATSGLLVYYSQFARYWTLVFLLSCVYPYALYLAIRDRSGRALVFGIVTGLLAVLAHPVSIVPLGALAVWIIAVYVKHDRLSELWRQQRVRRGVLLTLVLAVIIALRFVPILHEWILEHDRVPLSERGGEFLLHVPGGPGLGQISLLLAYVESLTLPLVLSGILGIYLLWQERARQLALLLACLFLVPIAFIMLVSIRAAISTFYLLPAVPPLFIGAGVFLDRLAGVDWELRPRWLLSATVATMIVATGAPTLISQYRDGRRYDFRSVAHWLEHRLQPGDVLFSDQPQVMAHYLPRLQVRRLVADPARLSDAVSSLQQAGGGGAVWIVAPAPSHAFRTNPKLGGLNNWIYDDCQLRNIIGVGRVDFRQNLLQVYRCPSTPQLTGFSAGPTSPARPAGP